LDLSGVCPIRLEAVLLTIARKTSADGYDEKHLS
jgi:hypothetical protein